MRGKSVKKRVLIVGSGVILLGFGITGLALMHKGLIFNPSSGGSASLIEQKLPEPSPNNNKQAAVEEKPTPPAKSGSSPGEPQGNEDLAGKKPQNELRSERAVPVPQVGKGPRSYPKQNQLAQLPADDHKPKMKAEPKVPGPEPKNYVPKASAPARTAPAKQVVTVRFSFDPLKNREIKVARVHLGDRISIKVHRVGQPGNRIYLVFNVVGNSMRKQSDYGRSSGAVITPVRDDDQLTLMDSRQFGPELLRRLDSKEGAVLELGTGYHQNRLPPPHRSAYERGHFEIEMKISADNRWNIKPRSFL
jgi:hypothetical protein